MAECLQNPQEDYGVTENQDGGIDKVKEEEEENMQERDWITEQELGSSIFRESDTLWAPVKRLLNRRRKSRWGDWDGLHIEEEDFS